MLSILLSEVPDLKRNRCELQMPQEPRDHLLMAASMLMVLPCVLILFTMQRYFVRGIVMSGIKG